MTNDDWQAAMAELEAENVKLREQLEQATEKLSGCPFDRLVYELPLDTPCPVCGGLGHHDSPNLCLYPTR